MRMSTSGKPKPSHQASNENIMVSYMFCVGLAFPTKTFITSGLIF